MHISKALEIYLTIIYLSSIRYTEEMWFPQDVTQD